MILKRVGCGKLLIYRNKKICSYIVVAVNLAIYHDLWLQIIQDNKKKETDCPTDFFFI